jgi:hypothetical protein
MVLLEAAGACAGAALLLLLHHGWTHFFEDPATSVAQRESCAWVCYFQMSDVGNCRTWNHEMFIIGFLVLAGGLLIAEFVLGSTLL